MPVPIYISSHFMYIVALQDLYSYGSTSRSNSKLAKVAKVFLSGAQVRRCTFSGCGFVLKRALAVVSGLVYSLASHRSNLCPSLCYRPDYWFVSTVPLPIQSPFLAISKTFTRQDPSIVLSVILLLLFTFRNYH